MGEVKTVVLFGRLGSGRSATGNSILGHPAFISTPQFQGMTTTCQSGLTVLEDGKNLKVIDTPALFDSSMTPEYVEKEIVRCIELAKDGIHAVLIVVSLRLRFSEEDAKVVNNLKRLFGPRILDYMIVAFAAGDLLNEDETLDDRLSSFPESLKELLEKCGNRRVVFDNKTKDEDKIAEQRHQLLTLINDAMMKNGGKPYYLNLLVELKNEDAKRAYGYLKQAYNEEKMQQLTAETKRNEEMITKLEKDLEKLQKKNEEMINNLKGELQRAQRVGDERTKDKERKVKSEIHEFIREELETLERRIITNLKEDLMKLEKKNEEMIDNFKEELQRAQMEGDESTKDKVRKAKSEIHELIGEELEILERRIIANLTEDLMKLEKKNEEMIDKLKEELQMEGDERAKDKERKAKNEINELIREELEIVERRIITSLKEDLVKLEKKNEEMIDKLKEELQRAQMEGYECIEDKESKAKSEIHELRAELEILKRRIERVSCCPVL